MSGFSINLATLPAGRSRLEVESTAGGVGLADAEWPGEIRADLSLDRAGEQITVRGLLRAQTRQECVRCLKVYDHAIETELVVYADRSGSSRHVAEEGDLEREDLMKFHDGRSLDVGPEVREALLLEVPMSPRCREDCRGLCATCGADLNEGPCGCESTRSAG